MPLLRKGVPMPVEGRDHSQPTIFISDRSGFPKNMRYHRGILRKRPGKTVQGGQANDQTQIMGLGKLELSTGAKKLVRATKTKLEALNTATGNWEVISHANYTGGNEDFFAFADVTENDLLVITNYIDAMRKWTGSGNTAALGGSPPKAKYLTYLSPYLMAAYIFDGSVTSPWKVQWPDTSAPETWSGGNSGSALVSAEPSIIQNIAKLNEFAAVYKKESLHLGRLVDPPDIFIFDPIKTGVGLAAPRAFADAEGVHYFMGANDFYAWNGPRVEAIGGPVRDEVFSTLDRNKINRCFAIHVQEDNEIWFFIIVAGLTWPQEVWKYNYRRNVWFYDTCDSITAAIKWERVNTVAWNDATGTWDQQQTSWDASMSVATWEDILLGLSTGYCHKVDYTTTNDNGVAVDASFQTKDFIGDTLDVGERWLQLDVWAKGPGKLWLDYSTDFGSTWTNVPWTASQAYADLDSVMTKKEWYLDVWAEHVRFRVRNDQAGETFYIESLVPYFLAREEMRTRRT